MHRGAGPHGLTARGLDQEYGARSAESDTTKRARSGGVARLCESLLSLARDEREFAPHQRKPCPECAGRRTRSLTPVLRTASRSRTEGSFLTFSDEGRRGQGDRTMSAARPWACSTASAASRTVQRDPDRRWRPVGRLSLATAIAIHRPSVPGSSGIVRVRSQLPAVPRRSAIAAKLGRSPLQPRPRETPETEPFRELGRPTPRYSRIRPPPTLGSIPVRLR